MREIQLGMILDLRSMLRNIFKQSRQRSSIHLGVIAVAIVPYILSKSFSIELNSSKESLYSYRSEHFTNIIIIY